MRIPAFDHARPFGMAGCSNFDRDGTHFVGLAARWAHLSSPQWVVWVAYAAHLINPSLIDLCSGLTSSINAISLGSE
jgi:hypothetical protein